MCCVFGCAFGCVLCAVAYLVVCSVFGCVWHIWSCACVWLCAVYWLCAVRLVVCSVLWHILLCVVSLGVRGALGYVLCVWLCVMCLVVCCVFGCV